VYVPFGWQEEAPSSSTVVQFAEQPKSLHLVTVGTWFGQVKKMYCPGKSEWQKDRRRQITFLAFGNRVSMANLQVVYIACDNLGLGAA
jgi:hypothetical protein